MGKSALDFQGQLAALSLKKTMGMNVDAEVEEILKMAYSEGCKEQVLNLCRALGLK